MICEQCGGTLGEPLELEFISGDCKDSCHNSANWRQLTNSHDALYPGCKVAVDGTYAALRSARDGRRNLMHNISDIATLASCGADYYDVLIALGKVCREQLQDDIALARKEQPNERTR